MRVTVSGTSYRAAIADSAVPREERWPKPTARRHGKGYTYTYEVDNGTARLIAMHLEDLSDCASGWGDPQASQDARSMRDDARRIRASLAQEFGL